MTLSLYFFRQYLPPFVFGSFLFLFVLLLDRLFDIIDLIFNKGVQLFMVLRLFLLFIPTILPLTTPMAALLACLITFGRLAEENEITAVRAAGISLDRTLWLTVGFSLLLSFTMIPFNTRVAPWSNQAFRNIYEKIATADPLINVEAKKMFSIKDIKIYAESIDKKDKKMKNLFVYQLTRDQRPAQRIFSRVGYISNVNNTIRLQFGAGQMQQYDSSVPANLRHTTFSTYELTIPIKEQDTEKTTRFRNIPSHELKKLIHSLKSQNREVAPLLSEFHLRYAIAFASLSLVIVGIPLASTLKKGGRGVGLGLSLVVLFIYYTILIFGLTLGEKNILPPILALWLSNAVCLTIGAFLFFRMRKK